MFTEAEVVTVVETISLHELRGWVHAGWIAPAQSEQGPVFDELDVARIRLVQQLRRDLAVPEDAVPLVLSLLDQVHGLRRELRTLTQAVDAQPAPIRTDIRNAYQALLRSRNV